MPKCLFLPEIYLDDNDLSTKLLEDPDGDDDNYINDNIDTYIAQD